MYKFVKKCVLTLFVLLVAGLYDVFSQDRRKDSAYIASVEDSIRHYYKLHPRRLMTKEQKKFKVIPIFGVNYSKEAKLSAIAGFSGTYCTSYDLQVLPSQLSVVTSLSTNLSFTGVFSGINYAAKSKFKAEYFLQYHYIPLYFWGLGYDCCSNDENRILFKEKRIKGRADLLYRRSNILLTGGFLGYDYCSAEDLANSELLKGNPYRSQYLYLGFRLNYDLRDNIFYPTEGMFISFEQSVNFSLFSSSIFYKTNIITDFYFPAWRGAVFAADFFADLNSSETPWTMWTLSGGAVRMRGYYSGRYRDRNMVSVQLELRQIIYKYHGIAIWGGAGNLFPSFKEIEIKNTLPTWGAGYRLSISGLILRFDVGFGRNGECAVIAGVNHSF